MAATAGGAAMERDGGDRVRRLRSAASDRIRQRLRPTRPRMRALRVAPGARFSWQEVAVPRSPGPKGAIVHPIAVATCDLDRALALGKTPFALPLHFGHECVAEVLSVGEQVTSIRVGQRVVVPFQINCGECRACKADLPGNCTGVPPLSMYGFGIGGGHWGGAYSDQLAVPFADAMLVPLPDGIDPVAAASVADNVSDGWRHIGPHLPKLLERDPDAAVLIVGSVKRRSMFSPSLGLYAGLIAQALGARHVRFADTRPEVREHAERLGLDAIEMGEIFKDGHAELTVDASGTAPGLQLAIVATGADGICSSAGGLHRTARLPTGLMYARNATYVVGRTHARAVIPHVLELMAAGKLHPEQVTTTTGSLDDAPRILRQHVTRDSTKTILSEG
jgi:alcohol dehydrogenase